MNEESSVLRDFTNGFGIAKIADLVLIIVAIAIGGWLVYIIETFFNNPSSIALLQQLAEANFEIVFTMNNQLFTLQAPDVLIYGVPLILLLVIIRMVTAFTTMGSQLLQIRAR